MSRYVKGAVFERAIIAELQADGYTTIRAGRSFGPVDVMAWKAGRPVLLISASTSGDFRAHEREAHLRAARELARAQGVEAFEVRKGAKRGTKEWRRVL